MGDTKERIERFTGLQPDSVRGLPDEARAVWVLIRSYRDEGAGCLTRRALLDDLGLGPDDLDPILADLTDEGVIQRVWTPGGRAYRALDGGQ